jgi:phosphatidylglycerophosphatase A
MDAEDMKPKKMQLFDRLILLGAHGFGLGRIPVVPGTFGTLVPITWWSIAFGFVAFRCFDILKPVPVKYFEDKFSGGAGIVLDDIMAGVLAALVLKFLYIVGLF